MDKIRVGIFFGGQSREREISFAGGRTVFDNLNKELFEPVPIFVDSNGRFIHLNWQFLYKGTIRDFYPPVKYLKDTTHAFQVYLESLGELSFEKQNEIIEEIGQAIDINQFNELIDVAFLALHGPFGEDGNIQGILEWCHIPYTGSGILPSAIGINKAVQKDLMVDAGFPRPKNTLISQDLWDTTNRKELFETVKEQVGFPFVVKSPYQGSSIGITILKEDSFALFELAVNKSFFREEIKIASWNNKSEDSKISFLRTLTDLREGIGLPVYINDLCVFHPEDLLDILNNAKEDLTLISKDNEDEIIIESFIQGDEFSCIVVQDLKDKAVALPPTGIVKRTDFFDYRSKYLPGMSRKETPIQLPLDQIQEIRKACEELFQKLHFNVYARIDGFITKEGDIFLNDPNTTSGMMPSSFFFHQAAEIGINPSQFLTYIIYTSLKERKKTGKNTHSIQKLIVTLEKLISASVLSDKEKVRVGVILGGYSSERHISVESGRNIFEKLTSSEKYEAIPIFLSGNADNHELNILPINILLKDNADDIRKKVFGSQEAHPIIEKIREQLKEVTQMFAGNPTMSPVRTSYEAMKTSLDVVFIALHGRPGEDGDVQAKLDTLGIPYNGSGPDSSQTTINKYRTNKILRENGFLVAEHELVLRKSFEADCALVYSRIEKKFGYPIIIKPVDDGCSSAVKKINNRKELEAFTSLIFRDTEELNIDFAATLGLQANEEFPVKQEMLVEELISKKDAVQFLEITGGLLTKLNAEGEIEYEIFEPSEALATGAVLSLEEKFLAGEGQNITPARYSADPVNQRIVSEKVRETLLEVAKTLNVQGYARIDAFVKILPDNKVKTYIIEINSLPGMTPATCIFHQCAIDGYTPYQFIDAILDFGIKRIQK